MRALSQRGADACAGLAGPATSPNQETAVYAVVWRSWAGTPTGTRKTPVFGCLLSWAIVNAINSRILYQKGSLNR